MSIKQLGSITLTAGSYFGVKVPLPEVGLYALVVEGTFTGPSAEVSGTLTQTDGTVLLTPTSLTGGPITAPGRYEFRSAAGFADIAAYASGADAVAVVLYLCKVGS